MIALSFLLACRPSPGPDPRLDVLAHLSRDVVSQRYHELEERTEVLEGAAADVCLDPTVLDEAREAWWSSREPWKRTEIAKFGPTVEYPERLGPKLDDWPVDPIAVEDLVAADTPLDFGALGTATRGLPVVEYLLHAGDPEADLSGDPRRCEVLAGASADVHTNAALLARVWDADWADELSDPTRGGNDAYAKPQDILDEWVNRMAFTVENIRGTKLGVPNGDSSGGVPVLDALESRSSGRSLTDAHDALVGVRDVWDGLDGPGIRTLVPAAKAERIDGLFDESAARLDAIPEPLEQTVQIEPEVVTRAQEALQALQVAIQVDLSQELGVTVTFNDNDGD